MDAINALREELPKGTPQRRRRAHGDQIFDTLRRIEDKIDRRRTNHEQVFSGASEASTVSAGVHPDLVKVVERAIAFSQVDFTVPLWAQDGGGTETPLVAAGASKTMNSRHLTGHAVDLAPLVGGEVRWDWPLYYKIAAAMKEAAADLKVPLAWGGDWKNFRDGPHFELTRKDYP